MSTSGGGIEIKLTCSINVPIEIRTRWWVRPALRLAGWLTAKAGRLATLAVRHGITMEVRR